MGLSKDQGLFVFRKLASDRQICEWTLRSSDCWPGPILQGPGWCDVWPGKDGTMKNGVTEETSLSIQATYV